MMPSPRATMPLVPLIGQSRNARPFAPTSRARRSVSVGEMVLIWMIVCPAWPATASPRGPRTTSSTAASDGRTTHTASAARATASADGAAWPPSASRARAFSATTSWPTTSWPPPRRRAATAEPSRPSPTIPIVAIRGRGAAGRARQGSWDHAARVRDPVCGWAPPGRVASVARARERVPSTPATHARRRRWRLPATTSRGLGRGTLAVRARREVARVDGVREELLRVVDPELADGRDGVDDHILETAADALDLTDVNVLDRVAVLVEPHRPPRCVGEIHAPERGDELLTVLDVAPGRLERRLQHDARDVRSLRVVGRHGLGAGLFVGPLEAGRALPAEGEVVADHGHPLVAEVVVDPFAERVRRLRARPARAHDPRAALALREVVGGHDRMDSRDLLLVHVGRDRVADRRAHRAEQHVDPLPLDEAPYLGEARGGLALVVLDDELHVPPRELTALLVEEELEAVDHVPPVGGEEAGLGHHEPDLDRAFLGRAGADDGERRRREREQGDDD